MKRISGNGLKTALAAGGLIVATTSAQAQETVFGDFVWHHIDAYCTFMKADNVFNFDDPESWRFVAFANYPNENVAEPLDRLFIRINADYREFDLVEEREEAGIRRQFYRTPSDPVIEVEMQIHVSEKGYKSTGYEGVLIESRSGNSIAFKGDCGV